MYFQLLHGHIEEEEDEEEDMSPGELKHQLLIAELLAHHESIGIPFLTTY
jgi:hypothetical protein